MNALLLTLLFTISSPAAAESPAPAASEAPKTAAANAPKAAPAPSASRSRGRTAAVKPARKPAPESGSESLPGTPAPEPEARAPLAAPAAPRPRRKAPSAEPAAPPPAVAASASPRDVLTTAGLVLEPSQPGLRVLERLPDSEAAGVGLLAGDLLLYLNGRRMKTPADAARALQVWQPGTRLSAVVSRNGGITALQTDPVKPRLPETRTAAALTPMESSLRDKRLSDTRKAAPASAADMKALGFRINPAERIWVRFPKGLPAALQTGDVIEGETSTSMATSPKLDFLAIPRGSRVWAQAVSVTEDGPVRSVRLHVYKIGLAGGKTYPCSAIVWNIMGEKSLARVAPGGVLISAPEEDDPYLLDPDQNVQIEFLEAFTLYEPRSFFQAGPGIWFRTAGGGEGLEVTHVIAGRAAERAGIRKGDRVLQIARIPVTKLGFSEAIGRLYGEAGSAVELQVLRQGRSDPERASLQRGVVFRNGLGISVGSKGDGATRLTQVEAGSPAHAAGLREGDSLLRIGDEPAEGLPDSALKKLLAAAAQAGGAFSIISDKGKPRTVKLKSGWYSVPLDATSQLKAFPLAH
ncbi:MAG: hypothetical protein A2X36_16405 [Elusimicrobia bacterium GWA2_69_24]|nr:MAG: hypothetical protein A2X36_16405 [Elusimicrobia bacterium GWA2_69_24]HBL18442.1 hypothetical protein [Elusimicrobiota bacterium]